MAWGTTWNNLNYTSKHWDEERPYVNINNLKKDGSNLIDGEKNLYFQCEGCEILFDPATKSFATLHDAAHGQGWKVKWNINGLGYKIYCPSCVGNANG